MAVSKSHVLVGALAGAGVAVAAMAGAGMHSTPLGPDGFGRLIKASTQPVVASTPGAPMSFADIFEKVSPAVVSIKVTSRVDINALHGGSGLQGFPPGFPFGLLPHAPDSDDEDSAPAKAPKQMSSGSGFFI